MNVRRPGLVAARLDCLTSSAQPDVAHVVFEVATVPEHEEMALRDVPPPPGDDLLPGCASSNIEPHLLQNSTATARQGRRVRLVG